MRLIWFSLALCIFMASLESGCRSKPEAKTPEEFIEMYSKAWREGDADAILELQVPPPHPDAEADPALRKALDDSLKAVERDAIVESIRRHDFAAMAWSRTTFESARDHGDHVHVDVRVDAARSEIVLVRSEGVLRVHPNPGQFQ